jgi:3D (Asp-Asp-Asp) domain-containing protein
MKSIFGSSAIVATAIVLGSLIISAKPSAAETTFHSPQDPAIQSKHESNIATDTAIPIAEDELILGVTPAVSYVATAYSLRGRTASGRYVSKGIIAADPKILPLGSRVHLQAGSYSGEYIVADTGGAVRGRRIDIWTPSTREAFRFGRRTVRLTVLSYGPKRVSRSAPAAK